MASTFTVSATIQSVAFGVQSDPVVMRYAVDTDALGAMAAIANALGDGDPEWTQTLSVTVTVNRGE